MTPTNAPPVGEEPATLPGLAARMAERTQALHRRAERTGVIGHLLAGTALRRHYTLLLRNLLPAYEELERGLDHHRRGLGLSIQDVYRSAALRSDLLALSGPTWPDRLPLLPGGRCYAHRVRTAAQHDGARLIGHAYARYLGDLSGGRIVRRRVAAAFDLDDSALAFYDFPAIGDLVAFKAEFRDAIDRIGRDTVSTAEVVQEAAVAFRLNIRVAESVLAENQTGLR